MESNIEQEKEWTYNIPDGEQKTDNNSNSYEKDHHYPQIVRVGSSMIMVVETKDQDCVYKKYANIKNLDWCVIDSTPSESVCRFIRGEWNHESHQWQQNAAYYDLKEKGSPPPILTIRIDESPKKEDDDDDDDDWVVSPFLSLSPSSSSSSC